MIYIWEQNYTGSTTTLTGADEPFVTQEDFSDDIFSPVRGQTGTFRVMDETNDSSLLETLIPQNNTQKLITLISGTWSGDVFTDSETRWIGFLCAEAFTQPWDNQKKIIEFPVKSLLSALEDVQIPIEMASLETNIAMLIRYAFEALSVNPRNLYVISNLYFSITNNYLSSEQFLWNNIKWSLFFSEEEIMDQGDVTIELVGISYREALSMVLKMYGLMFRETGENAYISMYDGLAIKIIPYSWNKIVSLSEGNSVIVSYSDLPTSDLLSSVVFKGQDNVAGFLQGRNSVQVTLSIGGLALNLQLPHTTQDSSTVVNVSNMYSGHLYVQPHTPRTLGYESFSFGLYHITKVYISENLYNLFYSRDGNSDYADCLSHSVLYSLNYDESHYVTGAFPCRWVRKDPSDHSAIILQNGLFLCCQSITRMVTPTTFPWDQPSTTNPIIYTLQSLLRFNWNNGFININFNLHSLIVLNNKINYQIDEEDNYIPPLYLYCQLVIGSYYWNGSSWSDTESDFTIYCKNGKIQTNKDDSMNVSASEGWFIPITQSLNGYVTFKVLSIILNRPHNSIAHWDARCSIMSNLKICFFQNNDFAASDRTENTYREHIEIAGFGNPEKITLQLGTINNNIFAPCFIKNKDGNYVEKFTYLSEYSFIHQRPELNLLARMRRHYQSIRHSFIAIIGAGVDILAKTYLHNNRNYFAIDKQHNWRDDTQEVKFIEVS